MKSVGIIRKLDVLGRVVLAKELRDAMDLPTGTPLEVYTEGDKIILKKYEPGCTFCGEVKDITWYKGKNICKCCIAELRA